MRKRLSHFFLACLVLPMCIAFSAPMLSYATDITTESSDTETMDETEEEREATSSVGQIWKDVIDMVKDFFLGPSYDDREHIGDVRKINPYSLLGDMGFPDDASMREAKDISASFYQLICAISVLGLVLSFIGAGISIAINKARSKPEVEAAILTKIAVFAAICCVAGLWGILVPLLKIAAGSGA